MNNAIRIRRLALLSALAAVTATALAQDPLYRVEEGPAGEGPITVEQKRDPADARVQADVMARLRAMENIEGIIGVETHQSVVRLTGKVTTSGQAYRAGREARNVAGVGNVDNEIRAKVGATF